MTEQLPSLLGARESVLDEPRTRAPTPTTARYVPEPLPRSSGISAAPEAREAEPRVDLLRHLPSEQMVSVLQGFIDHIGTTRKALFTAPDVHGKAVVMVGVWNVDDPPGGGVVYRCDGQMASKTDPEKPAGKPIYNGELPHRDYPLTGPLLQEILAVARPASEEEWLIPPETGVLRKDKPWSPPKTRKTRTKEPEI